MVYYGKPSLGCHACRQRKIKCDQDPAGCGQCARGHRECPGYRPPTLIVRDESQSVARKSQAAEEKKRGKARVSESPQPSVASSSRDLTSATRPRSLEPGLQSTPQSHSADDFGPSFFLSQFVSDSFQPIDGYMMHHRDFEDCARNDKKLAVALTALGLASYSRSVGADKLSQEAIKSYVEALQLTNDALKDPSKAVTDSSLTTIMLFCLFESTSFVHSSWSNHISGATQIVQMRGKQQLETERGRRLFSQVICFIVASAMDSKTRCPEPILELLKLRPPGPEGYIWRLQEQMVHFTNFYADLHSGSVSDPQQIVQEARHQEQTLEAMSRQAPSELHHRVFTVASESEDLEGRQIFFYENLWVARLENFHRAGRIVLNDIILQTLETTLSRELLGPKRQEHHDTIESTWAKTTVLRDEILANVPQSFGYAHDSMQSRSPPDSGVGGLPPKPMPSIKICQAHFILFPLAVVGSGYGASPRYRRAAHRCCQAVGQVTGIYRAFQVAAFIEKGGLE